MKMTIKTYLLVVLTLMSYISHAQVAASTNEDLYLKDESGVGVVRGTIIDDETGEPLIGVNILVEGMATGTVTDFDGNYVLRLKPGLYSLLVSYISYASTTINEVTAKANNVYELNIRLKPETTQISEVVVTARAIENTETALLTIQKKSANLLDGISSQAFSRSGDGDAASAIKRVTGVTVEGGKYVYVRGLGDRYSKSILNGLEIPGLDPERNTVQMDIFPTNVIDNIIVYKSFTPDLPGDFTGGMVDIKTKDFPLKQTVKLSASFGYDTETSFNKDFILYQGSKADAVGFGSKSRQLKFPLSYEPSKNDAATLYANTNSLNKELDVMKSNNFLNQSYSFSVGDQIDRSESRWGYFFALNYKNSYEFRPDIERSEIRVVNSPSSEKGYEYDALTERAGMVGINESLWSAMASASVKKNNNRVSLKYLHTQSGEKSATHYDLQDYFNTQVAMETSLGYIQRMISNTIVEGEHLLKNKNRITWGNAFTYTSIDEPDLTTSEFTIEPGTGDTLFQSGSSNVDKIFRELSELNNNAKFDFEMPFDQWGGLSSKFKAGVSSLFKMRDYETYIVSMGKSNNFSDDLSTISNGLNSILATENLYSPTNSEGYLISNVQADDENKYRSMYNIIGMYVMTELPLAPKFKFNGGLRVEYALMNYQGTERLSGDPINTNVLNSWQFLPSANFVLAILENMNLRTSYSRTVARPSFREKSESIIYDPVEGTTYFGNLDLVETNIHNADLRWEYYFGRGEMFSVSGFYKKFNNPIEIEPLENAGPNNILPVNREAADVYGFEVEFRKNFGFITQKLENLALGLNFTYVQSRLDLSDDQKEKYMIAGVEVPKHRELSGQSPYVVNASLSYDNPVSGTEINVSYNMKGKTLVLPGIGETPDIFEDPYHGLDFKFSQSMGKNKQASISVTAGNLVGDNHLMYYEFLDENAGVYRQYSKGRTFSLGASYTF